MLNLTGKRLFCTLNAYYKGIMMHEKNYCLYYLATIEKKRAWILASVFRGAEHVCFDRALPGEEKDLATVVFEIFVPNAMELVFLSLVEQLKQERIILSIEKIKNRYVL